MFGIRDVLGVCNLLVVSFAWIGLTEIRHSFSFGCGNQHILVSMDFLLATVVQSLFFSLFWPLAASFRAINNGIGGILLVLLFGFEFLWISFWENAQIV